MKKIFTLIIVLMAIVLPLSSTQASDGKSEPTSIILILHPLSNNPNPQPHRAPIRLSVEAWYESSTSTISIIYYGEATGEVNLYKEGQLIESSSDINTTFTVPGSGFYIIEINTDIWSATGSIEI